VTARQINKWGEGGRLRSELLEAATRLLARATARNAVTLRAIAREAGIAAPSIYKHFADRDAVIDAVVSNTFQELDAVCEKAYRSHAPGPARVRAISRAYVAFATEHPDRYRILFERSSADLSATPGPYPAGLHAFQYLAEAIKEANADDAAASGRDPFQDAEALWVALHGVVTLVPATPAFPWTPTTSIVDNILDRFTARSA
jgi:AcrR family transcriptional regulator